MLFTQIHLNIHLDDVCEELQCNDEDISIICDETESMIREPTSATVLNNALRIENNNNTSDNETDCEANLLKPNGLPTDENKEDNAENDDKKQEDELEKKVKLYEITYKDYLKIALSILLFFVDVYSDVSLAVQYFIDGRIFYALLTMTFVITPSVVANILLYEDTAVWRKSKRNFLFYIWIGPYIIFNIEPIARYISNILYVKKYLKYKKNGNVNGQLKTHKKFVKGNCNVVAVKDWEAMLEAVPQLVLQLFIILDDTGQHWGVNKTTVLQIVSLVTSAGGIWFSQLTSHKAFFLSRGQLISNIACCIFATARTLPLLCRGFAVAACMSTLPWVSVSVVGLHWTAVTIWWRLTGSGEPTLYVSARNSLLWLLTPFFRTVSEAIVVNIIMYLEDILLLLLWWINTIVIFKNTLIIVILFSDIIGRILHCWYRKYVYSGLFFK